MKKILASLLLFAAVAAPAERQIVNGVEVECVDGVCRILEPSAAPAPAAAPDGEAPRLGHGYMSPEAFLAFLDGTPSGGTFDGKAMGLVVLLVFLGGLAMNLTPCVLPMVPITLLVIGKSAARGAWYGAGIAVAYGLLGVLAAVGGLAFGEIQSSVWFNALVALVFAALALSLAGVFTVDFSKFRRPGAPAAPGGAGALFAFFMGALGAVLAGACVAPVLVSVLLLTADLFAKGSTAALALPFVMGAGMALPWPFAGAGMRVLPKPGAWMKAVNRVFAVFVALCAVWYGWLALSAVGRDRPAAADGAAGPSAAVVNATPDGFADALRRARRPVLVDCWASWCKNCTAMERVTFADPRVRTALKGWTVIRLQAEDIRALRALPGFGDVKGLPAFAVYGGAAEKTKGEN